MTLEDSIAVAVPLVVLAVSLAASRWLAARPGGLLARLDEPNERSLHSVPVPRTGGLALAAGLLIAVAIAAGMGRLPAELAWMTLAGCLVGAVSLADDFRHLHPMARLLTHFTAAAMLTYGAGSWGLLDLPDLTIALPGFAGVALTLLFVVWMINLYNFMDGMDGLAGSMAVIGFGALAILGWRAAEPTYAIAATCVSTAALGFLSVNFPPARIFLGDVGSSTLGLLAAGFALWGAQLGVFPLWVACLAFSPFIVDATWTLASRIARRERVWEPHRSHHYQRLVLAGWTHRKTLLRGYMVMLGAAACAVASPTLGPRDQWMLLGAWGIIYAVVHFRVRLVERLAVLDPPCTQ